MVFSSCQDEADFETVPLDEGVENEVLFVSFEKSKEIAELVNSDGVIGRADPDNANARKKPKKEKKVKDSKAFKDKKNRDAFYVFNYEDNQGFSIVSADMRTVPVLAYSDSNYFDLETYAENPGLMIWLESVKDHITNLRDDAAYRSDYLASKSYQTTYQGARIASGWADGPVTNVIPIPDCPNPDPNVDCGDNPPQPIQTWEARSFRNWGQGCGYNDFSPIIPRSDACDRSPAGCGPVAVAQVLYYHRNQVPSLSYNGVPINFNNMAANAPGVLGGAPDIARLMRFIGNSIIVDYAAKYALALPEKIPDFFEFIGFEASYRDLNHTTVANEIKARRPVIFKARIPGFLGISFNHHIWVCEGYRYNPNNNSKFYLMNWGQYGRNNTWYGIDHWVYVDSEGDSNNYSKGRKMITVR